MATSKVRAAALKNGWRSGLEGTVAKQFKAARTHYFYEMLVIPFIQPAKNRTYTPDFVLDNGIIIETKGRFVTADRQKILMVRKQFPDLDIRIAFSNPKGKIAKKSKTTYAMWCDKNGIKWCGALIPGKWMTEPMNRKSEKAIKKILKGEV